MKKVLLKALRLFFLPFALVLLLAPILGLLFAATIIAAAIAGWGFSVSAGFAYLAVAWKVYLGIGIFTFAFLITFFFQNCCVGLQSFVSHLRHAGWASFGEALLGAIIWPWSWLVLDSNLRGWGMSLAEAVICASDYWFVSSWRGVRFTHVNMQSGEVKTMRVKTPEEAMRAVKDTTAEHLRE